jgi:hypothetical protein
MIFIIFLEIFTFNKYIKRYFNVSCVKKVFLDSQGFKDSEKCSWERLFYQILTFLLKIVPFPQILTISHKKGDLKQKT